MILQAEAFSPSWIPARPLIEVAFLRMYNTGVTLSEFLETGVAVSLIKTFIRLAPAIYTIYLATVMQADFLFQQRIKRNFLFP